MARYCPVRSFKLLSTLFIGATAFAQAHLGYIPYGQGTKCLGSGGIGAAYPQDALIPSINPAGLSWIDNQFNISAQLINVTRKYTYVMGTHHHSRSGRPLFITPSLGYKQDLNECISLGVAFYGAGGLNTKYSRNNHVFGHGRMGLDYGLPILAPTISWRFAPCHSIGVSPLFVVSYFKDYGLQNFTNFSIHPSAVSNRGYNYAPGIGVRVGWMGRILPRLWVGASYSSKVRMAKYHKYRGLFAGGRLDMPEIVYAGVGILVTDCLHLGIDYFWIGTKRVPAIGNPVERLFSGPGGMPVPNLGAKNGPGFGWHNIQGYKIGLIYYYDETLTFRLGYTSSPYPMPGSQVDFNILAPGLTKHHYSFGFTWKFCDCQELDFAFAEAPIGIQKGMSRFGLGYVHIKGGARLAEIGYTLKF